MLARDLLSAKATLERLLWPTKSRLDCGECHLALGNGRVRRAEERGSQLQRSRLRVLGHLDLPHSREDVCVNDERVGQIGLVPVTLSNGYGFVRTLKGRAQLPETLQRRRHVGQRQRDQIVLWTECSSANLQRPRVVWQRLLVPPLARQDSCERIRCSPHVGM